MRQDRFAKKSLGQNFLTSTQVRDGILAEAGDLKDKKILEIGPGLGFLTEPLLAAGADLTAVEFDERAVKILQQKFGHYSNFNLICGDILQQDLDALFGNQPYAVIANIPYNITNPILRKITERTANKPAFALLMVQKEVAHKICDPVAGTSPLLGETERGTNDQISAQLEIPDAASKILSIPLQGMPSTPPLVGEAGRGAHPTKNTPSSSPFKGEKKSKRSILSIAVEVYAEAKYCFTVGREHFEPSPRVDSAIMRLDIRPQPLVEPELQRDFFTVVNAGFSEKRKKLGNVLGKFFGIPSDKLLGDIDGNRRAETLTIEEWVDITENFTKQCK